MFTGDPVGEIVSAWEFDKKLDILVNLNAESLESKLAESFVATKILRDFSLGYKIQFSKNKKMDKNKNFVEVSLVRKGNFLILFFPESYFFQKMKFCLFGQVLDRIAP